jgi:riboflavin-specific deaminase-like protein
LSTQTPDERDPAWEIIREANALAAELDRGDRPQAFGADADGTLAAVDIGAPDAAIVWHPGCGWTSRLTPDDPRSPLVDLYLPICSATSSRPIAVGHLGQSLDGFIATHSGDSQFVTGSANLVHLHRMRALCGVVVVGAGTVAADDPQLTTRYVTGPNPVRVVFDPTRRLAPEYGVFVDDSAETLYVCGQSRVHAGETHVGQAAIATFDDAGPADEVTQLLGLLRARGFARVFVEGGGVTVSAFLEANLLDRLHIAIAPVLIGEGRPAIRLAPHATLRECRRPAYRVFRMGGDVLFDCELNGRVERDIAADTPPVTRII